MRSIAFNANKIYYHKLLKIHNLQQVHYQSMDETELRDFFLSPLLPFLFLIYAFFFLKGEKNGKGE